MKPYYSEASTVIGCLVEKIKPFHTAFLVGETVRRAPFSGRPARDMSWYFLPGFTELVYCRGEAGTLVRKYTARSFYMSAWPMVGWKNLRKAGL